MPRSTSETLESLLSSCETQSTVALKMRDDEEFFFMTGGEETELPDDTQTEVSPVHEYLPKLLKVGELKETLGQATNRISTAVSNVDQEFGLLVAESTRKTQLADVVIRRLYRDERDPEIFEHRHFFTGKAVNTVVDEKQVAFDVIADTTAAGTCIAVETLSPNNGWVFPEAAEQSPPGAGDNPGDGVGGGVCFIGSAKFIFYDESSIRFDDLFENRDLYVGKRIAKSFDENNEPVNGLIESVFRHVVYEYLEVTFSDGITTGVTAKHPFFTETGKYIAIGKLKIGDRVFSDKGELIELVSVTEIKVSEGIFVHNAQIGEFKNYSADGKHVHNRSDDTNL